MQKVVPSEEYITSKVDGFHDRYIISHSDEAVAGPLVLYLHSGLAHAEQGFCNDGWCFGSLGEEVIRRHGVYVSPELRGDTWMNAAVEADLAALIVDLREKFDTRTVILTGTSLGGTAALIFASHHPDLIKGLIALCPATDMKLLFEDLISREALVFRHIAGSIADAYGGTPDQIPREYEYRSSMRHIGNLKIPIVVRHGDADEILPIQQVRDMVRALRVQGTRVRYDEIPGGDHAAPTRDVPWKEYMDFVLE